MNLKRLISNACACMVTSCTFTFLLFIYISNKNKISQLITENSNLIQILPPTIETESVCRWPPKNIKNLMDHETGFYDLSIPIKVQEDRQLAEYLKAYYDYLSKRYRGEKLNGSFLKRLVRMDKQTRVTGSTNNYHLYPQFINMEATVEAVKECRPVKQHPINNPKLQVLRIPAHVCPPKNFVENQPPDIYPLDLIVFIKSCIDCVKQRQRIRSAFIKHNLWKPFEIRFVFVTGIPADKDNFLDFFKTNTSQSQVDPSNTQFLATRRLIDESNQYEDLLIGNFHDTYSNLTLKQIFTFHWISLFCQDQSQLFLFLDDDHSIVPFNLIKLIRAIPNSLKPYFAGGSSYQPQKVVRPQPEQPNKYAIDENDFPWSIYAPYPTGDGYLLGSKVVQNLAIASRFTVPFRLEDVYVGILLYKLKHTLIKIPEMLISGSSKIDSEVISAMFDKLDSKIDWKLGKIMD